MALKKKRCLARKEQAAEYAKLLAQRQKEAKNRRQEELKRRRSASMRDSKSSSQSAPTQQWKNWILKCWEFFIYKLIKTILNYLEFSYLFYEFSFIIFYIVYNNQDIHVILYNLRLFFSNEWKIWDASPGLIQNICNLDKILKLHVCISQGDVTWAAELRKCGSAKQ